MKHWKSGLFALAAIIWLTVSVVGHALHDCGGHCAAQVTGGQVHSGCGEHQCSHHRHTPPTDSEPDPAPPAPHDSHTCIVCGVLLQAVIGTAPFAVSDLTRFVEPILLPSGALHLASVRSTPAPRGPPARIA